ncbi:MAG: response regulator transcription factor [Gemmatimonadota bacterium]
MIDVIVAVADPIAAAGFRTILDEAPDVGHVAQVDSLSGVREAVEHQKPRLVLLDVAYRRQDPELIPGIVRDFPGTRVMVFVDHSPDECVIREMLSLGGRARLAPDALTKLDDCCLTSLKQQATGCIGSGSTPETVLEAVRTVARGEVAAAPWLSGVVHTLQEPGGDALKPISARELDVMSLLAQGLNNKQIARELDIREQTVKNHVTRLMEKLGVRSRLEVGLLAARHRVKVVEEG